MTLIRSGLLAWRRWSGDALEDRDHSRDKREAQLLITASLFVFINAVVYSLVADSAVRWSHLFAPSIWIAVIFIAHLVIRTVRPHRDPFLLPIFALLAGWGLLLQDRLAPNFLGRQTLWFVLATAAMLLLVTVPRTLQPLMRYRYSLLIAGLILLAITLLFGVNPSGSGAALWLPLPFPFLGTIYFQPSELLKLLLVLFLASYFTELEPLYHYRKKQGSDSNGNQKKTSRFLNRHLPFLGPLLLMWGFTLLLLVWQQDLGAAALFFIVFVVMLYLATGEASYVISGLILLILAGIIAFFAFDTVFSARVLSWINPWPHVSDRAYQIVQALYAQAAGGVLGQGIGQGYPDFIPVVHSDFALAAISEEWGLIGSLTVVACFGLLVARGLRTALLALRGSRPQYFNAYIAAGLVTLLGIQSLLIMGGTTRLLPLTGITLPFVSYGGSSFMVSSLALGLLLYISAEAESIPASPPADAGLARRIGRLGSLFLIAFTLVAFILAYWSVVRADSLLAREDNPRVLEIERRVMRGRILDRKNNVLAESIGPVNNLTRIYNVPASNHVVGYYSLRFGSAGIENAYDDQLRGQGDDYFAETLRRLLHNPSSGADVRLTIDAGIQETIDDVLNEYDQNGAVVLLELTDTSGEPVAELRALASRPGYDPNLIDATFEQLAAAQLSPLVNRAAQGLYQPGMVLQPMITAAALDKGLITQDSHLADPFMPVTIHEQVLRCAIPRPEGDSTVFTWDDMGELRCPEPLRALGIQVGDQALNEIFTRFGLHQAPDLPIPTVANPAAIEDAGLAAVGQEALTVTPLQMALAVGALAGDGRLPHPRLVDALAESTGEWQTQPSGDNGNSQIVVSPPAAEAIRQSWLVNDGIATFTVNALSGPNDTRNTWFLAMTTTSSPRYVMAMILEGESNPATAEAIGKEIMTAALGN